MNIPELQQAQADGAHHLERAAGHGDGHAAAGGAHEGGGQPQGEGGIHRERRI